MDQMQMQRNMIDMPKLSDQQQQSKSKRIGSSSSSSTTVSQASSSSSSSQSLLSSVAGSLMSSASSTATSGLRKTSMGDFVKAVPKYDPNNEEASQSIQDLELLVPEGKRVPAISEEYQTALLQYTVDLLPQHLSGEGNNRAGAEDLKHVQPYDYHQVDIMVPASGQDERLRDYADHLGVALKHFQEWYETQRKPAILRALKQEQEDKVNDGDEEEQEPNLDMSFRLLVTRYPQDEQKTDKEIRGFQKELSKRTGLPLDQVILVRVGHDDNQAEEKTDEEEGENDNDDKSEIQFHRAHARNVLHQNACGDETCMATSMDVDMQVLPIFFHRALLAAKLRLQAYFPVVFSEFNPDTVQLVQDFLHPPNENEGTDNDSDNNNNNDDEEAPSSPLLPPFSKHRGLWRDFGYGMYALSGPDVKRFQFNEQYQGWGHEDNDFYKLVHNQMRVDRQHEHGLIHQWHPKDCSVGKDIVTEQQWIDCLNSRDVMEGSALGMLLRKPLAEHSKEKFPGLPKKKEEDGEEEVVGEEDDGDKSNEAGEEEEGAVVDKSKEEGEGEAEADSASEGEEKAGGVKHLGDEDENETSETSKAAQGKESRTSFQHKIKTYKKKRKDVKERPPKNTATI